MAGHLQSYTKLSEPLLESSYSNDKTRLIFQTDTDPPQLKYYKTSQIFSGSVEREWKICLNISCSMVENLESHIPLSSAYDSISGNTIYARVVTSRPSYAPQNLESGRIVLHPGEFSESHLRLGSFLPQTNLPSSGNNWNYHGKTDFNPGIACANSEIESYNCVLLWNDSGSVNGRFLYKYFKVIQAFGYPVISWDVETHQYTAYNITNGISAAFVDDKLYAAFIQDTGVNPYRKIRIISNSMSNQNSWSSSKDVAANDVAEVPTFLYKNGYEFGVIWTEIETGL